MHRYRRMICDMLLSETVQIDGNVVDIPRSLNLQRVYETIELSVLECMTKTQNGVYMSQIVFVKVSLTLRGFQV
jgi:hypothetical protein